MCVIMEMFEQEVLNRENRVGSRKSSDAQRETRREGGEAKLARKGSQ